MTWKEVAGTYGFVFKEICTCGGGGEKWSNGEFLLKVIRDTVFELKHKGRKSKSGHVGILDDVLKNI